MLYLEDYLEMIEHLPAELRDRFTDMREMDLSVQNRIDSLGERQKVFFSNCSKKLMPAERDKEFEKIRLEYKKVIEDTNENVQGAEECYSLVDRYLRKLDEELLKFKLELEADNRGITEILEQQSLELDAPQPKALKENKKPKKSKKQAADAKNSTDLSTFSATRTEKRLLSDPMLGISFAPSPSSSSSSLTKSMFPIQGMGQSGNAIATAASQAISATQQLSGRRTSSLKATYEAIHMGTQGSDFSIGRDLAGQVASTSSGSDKKRIDAESSPSSSPMNPNNYLDVLGGGASSLASEPEWNYDPSEPRYCICNQVSYGDMVACDNEDCPYEWFHYPCVGITASPKGKWFCPTCQANMSRRKGRK